MTGHGLCKVGTCPYTLGIYIHIAGGVALYGIKVVKSRKNVKFGAFENIPFLVKKGEK
jgi:hypothetical protein